MGTSRESEQSKSGWFQPKTGALTGVLQLETGQFRSQTGQHREEAGRHRGKAGQHQLRQQQRHSKRLAGILAATAIVLMAITGCTTQAIESPASGGSDELQSGEALSGFESYYTQILTWNQCTVEQVGQTSDYSAYFCTEIQAPLDWSDPSSGSITLAVAVHETSSDNALFYNLGGPGSEAVSSLVSFVENTLSSTVSSSFDVVAVDPRGIGQSTQVNCLTDAEKDELFSGNSTQASLATLQETIDFYQEVGEQCLANSGDLVANVDSYSVARDFDLVRSLLGQESFNYLGYSYGTYLGAVYAELFSDRVGRMVLDGAIDPTIDYDALGGLQASGFEESLDHWLELAADGEFEGFNAAGLSAEELKSQLRQFLADIQETPLETRDSDRPLTYAQALSGIARCLYLEANYPRLGSALTDAYAGDGTDLLTLADGYRGRAADGTYDNSLDVYMAVSALDFSLTDGYDEADLRTWLQHAQASLAANPVFGEVGIFAQAQWAQWPVQGEHARSEFEVTDEDMNAILVIGTTQDPATPYVMAESLAEILPSGLLLKVNGWSHTAYRQSASTCVVETVDGYFLTGEVANFECNS